MKRTVIAVVLAILLVGCASEGTPMSTPSTSAPSSPSPSPSHGEVSDTRWSAILADLDGRGVATGDVQLVSAKQVTWNDGSLGCPKKGQMYTQALVPGLQVIVSADGTSYDYRFGSSDNPKLCVNAVRARGIHSR